MLRLTRTLHRKTLLSTLLAAVTWASLVPLARAADPVPPRPMPLRGEP